MRRQLTAYLSEEEFHRLRDEADEPGITLSRYVKERLFHAVGTGGLTSLRRNLGGHREAHRTGDACDQRGTAGSPSPISSLPCSRCSTSSR